MKYERLTKWEDERAASINGSSPIDKDLANTINRLAELEDKIEDNVLIPIPLPLNSKAFIIMGNKSIKEVVIIKYEFSLSGEYAQVMWYEGDRKMVMYVGIDELNKTKGDAKMKLKELKTK